MDRHRGGGEVVARPARGAVGGEADRADRRGLGALADGVGDAQPGAAGHRAHVEPVAADVVGGDHRAGQLGALDGHDPRGHQLLLELGRGRRRLAAPGAREDVGVALGELQRGRRVWREAPQVADRGLVEDHRRDRAPAQAQRHDVQAAVDQRRPGLGQLGTRELAGVELARERRLAADAPQGASLEIDDVQCALDPGDLTRLADESPGEA